MAGSETIADRLREQLDRNHRSVRWLSDRATEHKVRGCSLASVQKYVSGRSEPPIGFLRAAAAVLDVREAWLIAGHGAPTEMLERIRQVQGSVTLVASGWTAVPSAAQSAFQGLRDGLKMAADKPGGLDLELYLSARTQKILEAPFGQWGFPDKLTDIPEAKRANYAIAILAALRSIVAEPRSLSVLDLEIERDDSEDDENEDAEPAVIETALGSLRITPVRRSDLTVAQVKAWAEFADERAGAEKDKTPK